MLSVESGSLQFRDNLPIDVLTALLRAGGIKVFCEPESQPDAWLIKADPRLSNGALILSPVLSGANGIDQADKMLAALHGLNMVPNAEPSLSVGQVPDVNQQYVSADDLANLNGQKILIQQDPFDKRTPPPTFEKYYGYEQEYAQLLYRGSMHPDGNLANRSKEGIIFVAPNADGVTHYVDAGRRKGAPHQGRVLPSGYGFMHVYEAAAHKDRPVTWSNLEDGTRKARSGEILEIVEKPMNAVSNEIFHINDAAPRFRETVLARDDQLIGSFLIYDSSRENHYDDQGSIIKIIPLEQIPKQTMAKINAQLARLDSQYISLRSPDEAHQMALETQAMGVPVEGSRIVVPRLIRESQNGIEAYEPGIHKLWKDAAPSSRGNPVLVAALLPEAAQVPHTDQAAFAYGIAPADMPANKSQISTDQKTDTVSAAVIFPHKVGVVQSMRR